MRHSFQRVDFSTIAALLEEETPAFTHSKQTFFCKHYKTLVRFEKAFFYPIHICTAAHHNEKAHIRGVLLLRSVHFKPNLLSLEICGSIHKPHLSKHWAIGRDGYRKFFDLSTPHQGVCQCAFCKTGRKFISFQVVKNINGQILSLCCKRLFSSVLVLHQNVNAIKFVSISPKLLGVLILLYIVVTTGMVLLWNK